MNSPMRSARRERLPPAVDAEEREAVVLGPAQRRAGRRLSTTAIIVAVVGLLVTAAAVWVSALVYSRNEHRLLDLRVRELGLVLASAVPTVQTPLASGVELADTTGGNVARFRAFMAPYVGPGKEFASASLWPLGAASAPTAVVGGEPDMAAHPARARTFFVRAERTQTLSVTGVLGTATSPRLGYEFNTPGVKHGYAVYVESLLPRTRRLSTTTTAGFSDLHYAVYLGPSAARGRLLVTDIQRFPIRGRQASDTVPFGDSALTLVVTPNGSLGGAFFQEIPWIIGIGGIVLVAVATLLADGLTRRRLRAEELASVLDRVADANRRMYTEQRSIAQTLQHALLPEALPQIKGLQVSARYVPAARGIDIGGDWYDLIDLGRGCALLVIGDVSGHGLQAATTMAALRHAVLAYAAEGHRPAQLLSKLAAFVNDTEHGYFATVLCALLDVDERHLTVASAGHLAPLVIADGETSFVQFEVGVPIGAGHRGWHYRESQMHLPPAATMLAYTDGLVERRGEILDAGMERLRASAARQPSTLDQLVTRVAEELLSADHDDDTAILGVRLA